MGSPARGARFGAQLTPIARRWIGLVCTLTLGAGAVAQVHYHEDGRPWRQRAKTGPDAAVDGWFYNLGITGIRVELVADKPKELLVRHVFEGSPAHRKVRVGDAIIGAGGDVFWEPHKNGYGMDVFGADGPIGEFAVALDLAQGDDDKGELDVNLRRDGTRRDVTLKVGRKYGRFSDTFPVDCKKSDRIRTELLEYLIEHQRDDGSFGNPVHNTFAPLALLAQGKRYLKAVEKCARWHARTTKAKDLSALINWRYMAAGIVLAEYHLATREKWVLKELQEIYDFLIWSQYVDPKQINPTVKDSHPDAYPKNARQQHGGWGHNPGFEGYGPICMLTGEGALLFALMHECGITIDRERHDAAYDFLARGAGANGYVWYADDVGGSGWADMGRTGAAGIANWLSPWPGDDYGKRALSHAQIIGNHPESFPDTHGSPTLGMGWAAVAAAVDESSFRKLMASNRWWFTCAHCGDGSFYYQPNRDNAGYGADARMSASAVVAFIFTIPQRGLRMTGRKR